MDNTFVLFEHVTRKAYQFTETRGNNEVRHPFERHNVHPSFPLIVQELFDNGHYPQATFEAFKFLDKEVQRLSGCNESGYKLMTQAFGVDNPLIKLTGNYTTSEKDEQKGYQFLFAGSVLAIRNPRSHEYSVKDSPDACLDHLVLASLLLRRLEAAGYSITA